MAAFFVTGVIAGVVAYTCEAGAQTIYRSGVTYSDVRSNDAAVVSASINVVPAYKFMLPIVQTSAPVSAGKSGNTTVVIVRPPVVNVNVTVQSAPTGWEAYDAAVRYRNSWR